MCTVNITLSVPDEVVSRAREAARQQGTSLNGLVRRFLEGLGGQSRNSDLADRFDAMWLGRSGRSGGLRWTRDELYDRVTGQR